MKALSLKRKFLFSFFLLCPLALLPVEELMMGSDFGGHIMNYASVVLVFLFVLLFPPVTVNRKIINVFAVLFAVLAINNLFAPYASNKMFFNQMGFLLCSFIIATTYAIITKEQKEALRRLVEKTGVLCLGILLLLSIYLIVQHFDLLVRASRNGDFNSFLYQLEYKWSWEKQSLGNLAMLVFSIIFVLKRKRMLLLLIPIIPMLAGIRIFWLAIISAVLFVGIKRRKNLLLIIPVFCVLSSFVYHEAVVTESKRLGYDIRIISFLNTYDIIKKMPFGVGLGGYTTYTEESDLASKFDTYYAFYRKIPGAPESDIVAVFGSIGLFLGGIFYAVNFWVAVKLWKSYLGLSGADRFFAFLFFSFLFSGIFQDNMFKLLYWIYFGFALGVSCQDASVWNDKYNPPSRINSFSKV